MGIEGEGSVWKSRRDKDSMREVGGRMERGSAVWDAEDRQWRKEQQVRNAKKNEGKDEG